MTARDQERGARFLAVTAAHHFLAKALPLREPDTRDALGTFLDHVVGYQLGYLELEAVLLRCFAAFDRHVGTSSPGLVDTYLASPPPPSDVIRCFRDGILALLDNERLGDSAVQSAIALIHHGHSNSSLRQRDVAACLQLRPAELAVRFKKQTQVTFCGYLREVRLDRAATLLADGVRTIKEVWAQVGYNHPSNFTHDFKHRFGTTPREYRGTHPHSSPRTAPGKQFARSISARLQVASAAQDAPILIVDDDEGTVETLSVYLHSEGYQVFGAFCGAEAIREVKSRGPGVVLLDYHLPDMDGLTCLRQLSCLTTARRPAVILFAADVEIETHHPEVLALGASVASKLCALEDIRELVNAAQRRRL